MSKPIETFAGPYDTCKPCCRCGAQPETGDRIYATDDGIVCTECMPKEGWIGALGALQPDGWVDPNQGND